MLSSRILEGMWATNQTALKRINFHIPFKKIREPSALFNKGNEMRATKVWVEQTPVEVREQIFKAVLEKDYPNEMPIDLALLLLETHRALRPDLYPSGSGKDSLDIEHQTEHSICREECQ